MSGTIHEAKREFQAHRTPGEPLPSRAEFAHELAATRAPSLPYNSDRAAQSARRTQEAAGVPVFPVNRTPLGSTFEPGGTPRESPPRRKILTESGDLIDGDRNASYGSPVDNFSNTAKLLNARFEHMFKEGMEFTAADVATIQILVKVSRMITSPAKKDHWLDVIGYAACGWECIEEGASEAT